jgi:hypothetical protein
MAIAPNLSYHYWMLGIKPTGKTAVEDPIVMIRGSEFEPEKEIEHEDDIGHTGTATTKMDSYRKKATANPKFEDKARYGEGWEDYWYLLLGEASTPEPAIASATKAKKYTFQCDPEDPKELAFATLYNGYAKTIDDAYVYDNCLLNELELKFKNDEPLAITPSFASNYPKFNQNNPTRVMPTKKVMIQSGTTIFYYAPTDVTLSDVNKASYAYPCFLEGSLKANNNIEAEPCGGDEFGADTKNMGEREIEGSLKLPWTEDTKWIETEYQSGANDGTAVSADTLRKQIMIESIGPLIETVGETPVHYLTRISIPEVTVTKCDSPQSGDEAKDLELEFKVNDTGLESILTVDMVTELTGLHIGTI